MCQSCLITPQGGDDHAGQCCDGEGDEDDGDGDEVDDGDYFRSVVALEGRRVELRCYASGYPPPGFFHTSISFRSSSDQNKDF